MNVSSITSAEKKAYNTIVTHPLQSYEWGEFREKEGIKVIRKGFFDGNKIISGFQLTIHKIPRTNFTIGYLPKGQMPNQELINELKQIGKEENCIFIQLEPNIKKTNALSSLTSRFPFLKPAAHPLFTKFTFILDLTKSEEELLASMHPKARYNIKVAKRHNVQIAQDNSDKAI